MENYVLLSNNSSVHDSEIDEAETNSFINFYLGISSSNSTPQINMANMKDATVSERVNESMDTASFDLQSLSNYHGEMTSSLMDQNSSTASNGSDDRPEHDCDKKDDNKVTRSVFYQKKGQTVFDFLRNVSLTSVPSATNENKGFTYMLSSNQNSETNLLDDNARGFVSGPKHLMYTKTLKEEILQWYNRIPLPHSERSSAQLSLLNVLIHELVESLYFASESFYEENARRQIDTFLEALLINYPAGKERNAIMKKFSDDLIKVLVNLNKRLLSPHTTPLAKHEISVKHKELKVEIQGWLDQYAIDFDSTKNKSKILKFIINKLGNIGEGSRVIDTRKSAILKAVNSIIDDLPLNASVKFKNGRKWEMANDLSDRLTKVFNNNNECVVQPFEFFDIKTIQLHNKIRDEVKIEVYRYFGKFVLAPAILDMICNIVVYPNGSSDKQMRSDICNLIQMTKRSLDQDKILLCIDNFLKKVHTLLNRTKSENLRENTLIFPGASPRVRENVQILHSSMTNLKPFTENYHSSHRGEMLMHMINEYLKKSGVKDVLTKEALIAMLMTEHKKLKRYSTPAPVANLPTQNTSKPISLQNFYMELEIVRIISEWLSHLPLKQNFNRPENKERTVLICDMAHDVYCLIQSNNNIIEDENELWELIMMRMRELPLLKGHDAKIPYLVNALTDQLENLIIPRKLKVETTLTDDQSAQTNLVTKTGPASQKDDMDVSSLTKLITDWLADLPTKETRNVEERIQRNLHIDALAKYIHFIKTDLHNALTSSDKEKLVTYLRDWLDKVLKPNYKAKYAEIMLQLMQRVKIIRKDPETLCIIQFSSADITHTPSKSCPAYKDFEAGLAQQSSEEENCTNKPCCMLEACLLEQNVPTYDLLFEHVLNWTEKLGLKGEQATLMRNRQCLMRNVLKKIGDLNLQTNLDDNEYAECLEKEVAELLDKLPPYPSLDSDKAKLKEVLIPGVIVAVKRLKDLEAAETYKNALEEAAGAVLPLHMCCSKQAEINLLKTAIAEEFIIGDCDTDAQNGCYTAMKLHKIQVIAQIHRAIDDGALPDCNPIQIKNNIKKALFTIPLPSKHVLDVEIKIIKTKNLVSQWFENLPLIPPTRPNDEVDRDKMKSYLAIRLYDAEIVPSQPRNKIKDNILKVLSKAPLRPGQESNFKKMADQLIDSMEATEMYRNPPEEKVKENPENDSTLNKTEPLHETSLFQDQPKNCIDLLYQAIEKWFESIKLSAGSPEQEEKNSDLKAQLELRLVLRIVELDTNDQMLNNTSLFSEKLSEAINEIIDCLPEEAKFDRQGLLERLVDAINDLQPEIRKDRARSCYKERLNKIVIKEIPTYNQMTPEERQKIKLYACQIIDEFIECNYHADSEMKSQHSVKVLEIAQQMFLDFKSKHDAVDPENHKNLMLCKLSKVPIPDEPSVLDELVEIRVKIEISKWYDELPNKKTTPSEAMHTYRVIEILAKKLIELEKAEPSDDKQEICDVIMRFMKRMHVHHESPMAAARDLIDRLKAVSYPLKGQQVEDNKACHGNGQGGPCRKAMCPKQQSKDMWSEGFCRITVYPKPGAATSQTTPSTPNPPDQNSTDEPVENKKVCKGSVCTPNKNIVNQLESEAYCKNIMCPLKKGVASQPDFNPVDIESIVISEGDNPLQLKCPFADESALKNQMIVRQHQSNEIIPSDDKYQILICPLNQPCPSDKTDTIDFIGDDECDKICRGPMFLLNQATAVNTREIDPFADMQTSCCCNCGYSEPTQTPETGKKKKKKEKKGGRSGRGGPRSGGGKDKESGKQKSGNKKDNMGGGGNAPVFNPKPPPVCPVSPVPSVCPPCRVITPCRNRAPCRPASPCVKRPYLPNCQSCANRGYTPRVVDRACGAQSCNVNADRYVARRPCPTNPFPSSGGGVRAPRYSNCRRGGVLNKPKLSSYSISGRRCNDNCRIQQHYFMQLFNNVRLNMVSSRWKNEVVKILGKISSKDDI